MKRAIRSIIPLLVLAIFFGSFVVLTYNISIGDFLEVKEETSKVVSENSIIYEHGFPSVGDTPATLSSDDSKKVIELEEQITALEEENTQLKLENEQLKK